jgi:hypothetical protein
MPLSAVSRTHASLRIVLNKDSDARYAFVRKAQHSKQDEVTAKSASAKQNDGRERGHLCDREVHQGGKKCPRVECAAKKSTATSISRPLFVLLR